MTVRCKQRKKAAFSALKLVECDGIFVFLEFLEDLLAKQEVERTVDNGKEATVHEQAESVRQEEAGLEGEGECLKIEVMFFFLGGKQTAMFSISAGSNGIGPEGKAVRGHCAQE